MRLVAAVLIALFCGGQALAADIAGSGDHPLVPRYEGSEIVAYAMEEFTDYRLLNAQARNYGGLDKNSTRRFLSKAR